MIPIQRKQGFTLLELMVAIAVGALIITIGGVKYIDFNKTQSIKAAGQTFKNNLRVAQSKATAGVKPTSCTSAQTLDSYVVDYVNNTRYQSIPVCSSANQALTIYDLPAGSYFASSFEDIAFKPVAAGVTSAISVYIKNTAGAATSTTKWYSLCVSQSGEIKDCGYTVGSIQPTCSC